MTSTASNTTAETVLLSAAPLHYWSCLYPGESDGGARFVDRIASRILPSASDTPSSQEGFSIDIDDASVILILPDGRTVREVLFPPMRQSHGDDWARDNPLRRAAIDLKKAQRFFDHVVYGVSNDVLGVFRKALIESRLIATGVLLTDPSKRVSMLSSVLKTSGYLDVRRNEIQMRQHVFVDVRVSRGPTDVITDAELKELIRVEEARLGRRVTQEEAEKIARECRMREARLVARRVLVEIHGAAKQGPKGPRQKIRESD